MIDLAVKQLDKKIAKDRLNASPAIMEVYTALYESPEGPILMKALPVKFLPLAALLFCFGAGVFAPSAFANQAQQRMIAGEIAPWGAYPYMVRLEVSPNKDNPKHKFVAFCSGSLIASRYVLTAAHCVQGMKEEVDTMGGGKFRVSFLNLPDRPTIDIARMDYWGGYSGMDLGVVGQSDLGIIELKQDSLVTPVALKSLGAAESEFKLLGYGPRAKGEIDGMNKYLGVARVAKKSFSHCQNLKEDLRVFDGYEICASGIAGRESGACHGDSGGALLDSTGALVGVTSWGAEENCEVAPAKRQTVFARVWPGMIWLRSQTGAELGGLPVIPKNISKPVFRKADISFKHGRIRISTQWQDTTGTKLSGSTSAVYGLMPKRDFKYDGIQAGIIDAKSLNVSAKIPAKMNRMSVKKYPYWLVVMYVSAYNGYHNASPEKLVVKFVRRRG